MSLEGVVIVLKYGVVTVGSGLMLRPKSAPFQISENP